jgi:hypothetical protein
MRAQKSIMLIGKQREKTVVVRFQMGIGTLLAIHLVSGKDHVNNLFIPQDFV